MKRIDCLKLLASLIQDELVVVTLGSLNTNGR